MTIESLQSTIKELFDNLEEKDGRSVDASEDKDKPNDSNKSRSEKREKDHSNESKHKSIPLSYLSYLFIKSFNFL